MFTNFQNLEYFITTAKEGNITRAAERMHISQQALSGSISRLESELGCELFTRRPSFGLTYAGKCFLKTATEILDLKEQGETMLADINGEGKGELKLGISHTRGQAILPTVLPEFNRLYPKVDLTITESSTKVLEDMLDKGLIDVLVGFMPIMVDGVVAQPLVRDRLMLVLPKTLLKEHFGDNAEKVCEEYRKTRDLRLFKDMPFVLLRESERIRTHVNRAFASHHIRPQIKTETYNIQTAYSLAAEGMGAAVCPEMYLKSHYTVPGVASKDEVVTLPFFADDVYDTIGIGFNSNRYLSRIAQDFIEICTRKTKSLDIEV